MPTAAPALGASRGGDAGDRRPAATRAPSSRITASAVEPVPRPTIIPGWTSRRRPRRARPGVAPSTSAVPADRVCAAAASSTSQPRLPSARRGGSVCGRQLAVGRSALRGRRPGSRPCRPADQEDDLAPGVEDWHGQRQAGGVQLRHVVGDGERRRRRSAAVPGKSEAVWPSSPIPSRTRSKRGIAGLRCRRPRAVAPRKRLAASSGESASVGQGWTWRAGSARDRGSRAWPPRRCSPARRAAPTARRPRRPAASQASERGTARAPGSRPSASGCSPPERATRRARVAPRPPDARAKRSAAARASAGHRRRR